LSTHTVKMQKSRPVPAATPTPAKVGPVEALTPHAAVKWTQDWQRVCAAV